MNDFLNDEQQKEEEISLAEEAKIRQEATDEIFNDIKPKDIIDENNQDNPNEIEDDIKKAAESIGTEKKPDVKPEEIKSDLPKELLEKLDAIQLLTSTVSNMENRLKKSEQRIGGINNKLAEPKVDKQKSTQIETPSKKEISDAVQSTSGWEDLTKEFPDWAEGIQAQIIAQTDNFVSKEEINDLRKEMTDKTSNVPDAQLEVRLVNLMHPNWTETVKSPEYNDWLKNQDINILNKANHGKTAEEAIEVLNLFKSNQKPNENNNEIQDIKDKRKKRLESSTTETTKHQTIKAKAEADMSEDELRQKIASEVFAT